MELKTAIILDKPAEEIKMIMNNVKKNVSKLSPYQLNSVLSSIEKISYDDTYDNDIKALLTALNRALYPKLQQPQWKQGLIKLKLIMKTYGLE